MKATRRTMLRNMLAALVAAPLLMAEKCEGAGGHGHIHVNKPPKGHEDEPMTPEDADEDWPIDGKTFRELRISVWVDPTAWPYSVSVTATDHSDNNHQIKLGHHSVERGQFVCPISFEASHDVSVAIKVECNQAPKRGNVTTHERNHRGAQIIQSSDLNGRKAAEWNMSPRRR